jgi:mannitol/fructose-specific phosphotransferase system IIA component (Ntr-type)/nucleotide-binding universal stress UspA family protein
MSTIHDPVGIFALLLAGLLFSAWLSDVLRCNIAVMLMVFGIIAGPEVAGLIDSGAVLQILGSIGIVYIFFFAGLSTRMSGRFPGRNEYRLPPASNGLYQFLVWAVLPASVGVILGLVGGKSVPQAVAMGLLFASAGRASSLEENRMKFSALEVYGLPGSATVLVVFVLLGLDAITGGADVRRAVFTLAFGCILAGLVWSLFPRLTSIFLRRVKNIGIIEGWFLFFLAFAASYAASFLSIPYWFTAYVVGLSLSSVAAPVVRDNVFGPAAFFLMGVSVHIGELSSGAQWLVWTGLFLGGGLATRMLVAFLSKVTSPAKGPMLGLAIPFTTFSLAVAWILYGSGLIDPPLFFGTAALALVSGIISNSLLENAHSSAKAPSSIQSEKTSFIIPNRILIALGNPSSIPQLLALGAILHGTENRSPLFPVTVHSPEESEVAQSAGSETILASAVMKLSEMQKPVLPLNVEAINPGQGIIESAAQKNADTIVIGWSSPPRLAHAFFGNIIDQIVSGSPSMVVVARGRFPWKSTKQILAVFPPLVEEHEGYEAALQCIKRLAQASFATLHCFIPDEHEEEIAGPWRTLFSSINHKTSRYATWREIPELFQKATAAYTSIVLISARPGEVSWSPAFERLPHMLAEHMPDANVLMLYMPSSSVQAAPLPEAAFEPSVSSSLRTDISSAEALLFEAVRAGRIQVNMESSALAEGLYKIIFSAFPVGDKKQLRALADRCIEMLQRQPIEIEPGVVLLHDRLETITHPLVCFGAQKKGYRLSTLENPVQIIVLILVPLHQSAEEHLRFLAEVASMFRAHNLRQRLLDATTPEDLLSPR